MGLITDIKTIEKEVESLKKKGKTIVTTNGVFDILHVGHIRYLQEAKRMGDVLIVAVNTDESVRANKGPTRPIVPLVERMEILAALSCVDYVFPFAERYAMSWIEKIKPNVHAKGGDYTLPLIEQPTVEKYGGNVRLIPISPSISTTNIIKRIMEHCR